MPFQLFFLYQPEEEIRKYTLDEGISECDRIKQLLEKRDANQFCYVFHNAANIFRGDAQMQGEILPILVAKVRCYSEEHQVLAGDALHDLIEQKVSSVQIRTYDNALVSLTKLYWLKRIADWGKSFESISGKPSLAKSNLFLDHVTDTGFDLFLVRSWTNPKHR